MLPSKCTPRAVFIVLIACLFVSCKTFSDNHPRPQVIDPRFPYKEHNINVISDRVNQEIAMTGRAAGKVLRQPKVAIDSTIKGFKGISDKNPYDRGKPYTYDAYSRDVLGKMGKDLMMPEQASQMRFPAATRASYLVEGADLEMTSEAVQYKQHLDEVSWLIMESEALMQENRFVDALVKINTALDKDPSSEAARAMYSQIVRAEERARYNVEMEGERAQIEAERQADLDEKAKAEKRQKAKMIEEYAIRIEKSIELKDYNEASRLAGIVRKIDPENKAGQQIADQVDLIIFKNSLDPRLITNDVLMEDMILEHLQRFQEYSDTGLDDLARRELQKITFLESLKNR